MTRQEAIEILTASDYFWLRPSEKEATALNMAIISLKLEQKRTKLEDRSQEEMTREEAARIITVILDCCTGKEDDYEEYEIIPLEKSFKALSMAIEALEQESKIGHWIYDYEYSNWFDVTYKCSCCKRTIIVPYKAKNEVYKD